MQQLLEAMEGRLCLLEALCAVLYAESCGGRSQLVSRFRNFQCASFLVTESAAKRLADITYRIGSKPFTYISLTHDNLELSTPIITPLIVPLRRRKFRD